MGFDEAANTVRNALRPGYLPVMASKVVTRLLEMPRRSEHIEARTWAETHAEDAGELCSGLDPALWDATQRHARELSDRAEQAVASLPSQVGGGGHHPLLYFLTRFLDARTVVETGVGAGFSSASILAALEEEGRDGRLYSTDFPYFRLHDPETYVGVLVSPKLQPRWELHLDGDRRGLPRILESVGAIDLFHYDSDKSYRGRAFATALCLPRLTAGGILLMDDIQDNLFFAELVARTDRPWRVFEFESKHVGLVGVLPSVKRNSAKELRSTH